MSRGVFRLDSGVAGSDHLFPSSSVATFDVDKMKGKYGVAPPWRWNDPYVQPMKSLRSGEGALNSRMSQDMPPVWGPENQHHYSTKVCKDEVYTWSLAARTHEERRGPLLYSQLSGVAQSTIHHWLEEPSKRTRRTARMKYGNRKYRLE